MAHAILSPSASKRWLTCTPSARLEMRYPESESEFAAEGTEAHDLCAVMLHWLIDGKTDDMNADVYAQLKDFRYYTPEMKACAERYRDYIAEAYNDMKGDGLYPHLEIERQLDLTAYAPECFGTGDAIIMADERMHIIDFKYGKGVEVEAEGNTQMRMYALGALKAYGMMYPSIKTVTMTIFQPRIGNISSDTISKDDLMTWADEVLRPTAEKAYKGEGELKAGSHCKFCRHAEHCAALKALAESLPTDTDAETLTDEQISEVLAKADTIAGWLKKVQEYALSSALEGKQWPGYKLVEGKSRRQYTDPEAIIQALKADGYEEAMLYTRDILTLTAMERLVGKKHFAEVCGDYIAKAPGKPTLAIESDKRPAYNLADQDAEMLKEILK